AIESASELTIDHGPHAVGQAWLLASWLVSRLGWRVQSGHMQSGVDIEWKLAVKHGPIKLTLNRLHEGPSEVRRMRVACSINGKPSALLFTVPEKDRLAVVPEDQAAAPRTLTAPSPPLAELIARQLSDRERDGIFRESMAAALELARAVLD